MPRRTSRSSREGANRREGSKQKGYKKEGGRGGITCTQAEACCQAAQTRHTYLNQKVLDPSIEKQFQRPKKPLHVRGLVETVD